VELIELDDVNKVYHHGDVEVPAMRGVSLKIATGEFVAIMGASGSGKSTMMNILGCLDKPTTGSYWLNHQDVSKLDRDGLSAIRNQTIGFVFQNFNLLSRTSAIENVELPLIYAGVNNKECTERAKLALERVDLGGRLQHTSSQLSGGQQQRVAIARALVANPKLILADEPTGNLDSKTSIDVMCLFQQLNVSGITIVLVTHELDIAEFAKRVVVMKDGQVQKDEYQTPRQA
jgi:putative ABC transport system ATP-binding protein